ncbi:MAG TPA: hypothetical protein DCY13_15665 [Verrucomicrobiales bacterium]|nr:hypothetical protein [Verrucomicrobiales bacterium]
MAAPSEPVNVRTRDIEPFQLSPGRRRLAWLIYWAIRCINLTLRWRLHDPHDVLGRSRSRPVIFCAWHNRLALALPAWKRHFEPRTGGRRIAAIASASRDGSLVAGVLQCFGAQPVRGSSSRRGLHAMLELVEWSKQGFDLAITPDGPRGPLYSVQPGIVPLAQLTGLPIVPICYNLPWKIRLKSWDRFQIPLPFSRCDFHLGELIEVPKSYRDNERAGVLARLRDAMLAITRD